MSDDQVLERLDNLDRRVDRIEQFLPTLPTKTEVRSVVDEAIARAVAPLATKEELREAVAKLATKEELREAVAKLATKEELREAVAKLATKEELREAVAKLATKEELRETVAKAIAPLATKEELREEGERSRRYMLMLFEDVRGDIRLFADAHGLLDRRDASQHLESVAGLSRLDSRVTTLEAKSRRRVR
jgi:alkylhydroperoxidase/carboxymuconolactone decarboxylase family protein YurZ